MKNIMTIFLLLVSFNVYSYTHSYSVSGVDENGSALDGSAYTDNYNEDNTTVNGQVTDENGDIHSFQGQWDGNGQIKGVTDDGEAVQLNVNVDEK